MLPDPVTLLTEGTEEEMEKVLEFYPQALAVVKGRIKNKKTAENLEELDKWCQEELGSTILSRDPPHLTLDDLTRLMSWKLARGKFRPALMGLVKGNAEQLVIKATTNGIKLAKENKSTEAVGALTVLKGVGPATASAILAVSVPEHFSFYADEVAESIPALKTHKYSLKDYEVLNSTMVQLAERLNGYLKDQEDKPKWTAHKAELAVWTYYLLHKHNQEVLNSSGVFDEREAKETKTKEKRREKIAKRNENGNDDEKDEESKTNGHSYKNKKLKT